MEVHPGCTCIKASRVAGYRMHAKLRISSCTECACRNACGWRAWTARRAYSHLVGAKTAVILELLMLSILSGLGPRSVFAATHWVSTENELREAVANSTVDTIYVTSSFLFAGSAGVTITRSMRIIGSCDVAGRSKCVLAMDGAGPLQALQVQPAAPGVRVEIRGVDFVGTQGAASHGAIKCGGVLSTELLVTDASFSHFSTETGAFFVEGTGCAVTCTNCRFLNNTAVSGGGAVHLSFASFTCHVCTFSGNRADRGGAIYITTRSQMELNFPTFSENLATNGGPDVYIEDYQFAALSFCPSSASPIWIGSPRAPVESSSCARNGSNPTSSPGTPSIPVNTSSAPGTPAEVPMTPPPWEFPSQFSECFLVDDVPSSGSSAPTLFLYPSSGVSQAPAGYPFGLRGMLALGSDAAATNANVTLTLTVGGADGGQEDGSSASIQGEEGQGTSNEIFAGQAGGNGTSQQLESPNQNQTQEGGQRSNVTFGGAGNQGHKSGCSGWLLDNVTPSQGSCDPPTTSDNSNDGGGSYNNASCSVVCHLGGFDAGHPISLQVSLSPVDVGARLAFAASISAAPGGAAAVPVRAFDGFGVWGEPIRVVDARQPMIAPGPGAGCSIRRMRSGAFQPGTAFVATSEVLRFAVIKPGLTSCNVTEAVIHIEGPGRVVNVTKGADARSLMSFEVLTVPDSAMVLHVAAGACWDASGRASLASEPLPVIVDVTPPSVTVTRVSGRLGSGALAVFRIQFSERVTGFTEDGVVVTGGILTCLSSVNKSAGVYEAIIRPFDDGTTLVMSLKKGAALDLALNPSSASSVQEQRSDSEWALSRPTVAFFKLLLLVATLVTLARDGAGLRRLVAYIGHLQFFQMIGLLDVPLDASVQGVLHDLAWINNAWPQPMFGMGGTLADVTYGSSAPHLFFASNGSCRGDPSDVVSTAGHAGGGFNNTAAELGGEGLHRTPLDDGVLPLMTLGQLNELVRDAHPALPAFELVAEDKRITHLKSGGDIGAIVLLCLCQLVACVALRATCVGIWWAMRWLHPSKRWGILPTILVFPRLELLVLMLTYPTMTQASVFYATSGLHWGILFGTSAGVIYPLAFVVFVAYFIIANILWNKECQFRAEKIYVVDGSTQCNNPICSTAPFGHHSSTCRLGNHHASLGITVTSYRRPYLLDASWTDRDERVGRDYVLQFGLLFEDLKGPTKRPRRHTFSSSEGEESCQYSSNRRVSELSESSSASRRTSLASFEDWRMNGTNDVLREWFPDVEDRGCFLSCMASHCGGFESQRITRGHLAAAYTLVVMFKQFAFAALTGISAHHLGLTHLGWFQVPIFILWLSLHLSYLVLVQPYIQKLPYAVELLATLCQLVCLVCCLGLLVAERVGGGCLPGVFSIIILVSMAMFVACVIFEVCCGLPPVMRAFWRAALDKLPAWLYSTNPGSPSGAAEPAPWGILYWGSQPTSPGSSVTVSRSVSGSMQQSQRDRLLRADRSRSLRGERSSISAMSRNSDPSSHNNGSSHGGRSRGSPQRSPFYRPVVLTRTMSLSEKGSHHFAKERRRTDWCATFPNKPGRETGIVQGLALKGAHDASTPLAAPRRLSRLSRRHTVQWDIDVDEGAKAVESGKPASQGASEHARSHHAEGEHGGASTPAVVQVSTQGPNRHFMRGQAVQGARSMADVRDAGSQPALAAPIITTAGCPRPSNTGSKGGRRSSLEVLPRSQFPFPQMPLHPSAASDQVSSAAPRGLAVPETIRSSRPAFQSSDVRRFSRLSLSIEIPGGGDRPAQQEHNPCPSRRNLDVSPPARKSVEKSSPGRRSLDANSPGVDLSFPDGSSGNSSNSQALMLGHGHGHGRGHVSNDSQGGDSYNVTAGNAPSWHSPSDESETSGTDGDASSPSKPPHHWLRHAAASMLHSMGHLLRRDMHVRQFPSRSCGDNSPLNSDDVESPREGPSSHRAVEYVPSNLDRGYVPSSGPSSPDQRSSGGPSRRVVAVRGVDPDGIPLSYPSQDVLDRQVLAARWHMPRLGHLPSSSPRESSQVSRFFANPVPQSPPALRGGDGSATEPPAGSYSGHDSLWFRPHQGSPHQCSTGGLPAGDLDGLEINPQGTPSSPSSCRHKDAEEASRSKWVIVRNRTVGTVSLPPGVVNTMLDEEDEELSIGVELAARYYQDEDSCQLHREHLQGSQPQRRSTVC